MEQLTQERLKEILHYNRTTGTFARIKNTPGINLRTAGTVSSAGYRCINVDGVVYYAHRLAWLYEYGYFPEGQLDHIDQVKIHNWIMNLREVTAQCNARNTGNRSTNTSGVKGVYRGGRKKDTWIAEIMVNSKKSSLGRSTDFTEAVAHRLAAEQSINWSGCDSSSPAFKYMQNYVRNVQQ